MVSFGSWLKEQKDRDHRIGDLSRDFLQALQLTGHRPSYYSTPTKFKKVHLKDCTWDRVWHTFDEAVVEYKLHSLVYRLMKRDGRK